MRAALGWARRGVGVTWPNPPGGCVLARDGRVLGRAHTAPGGRPHAEPLALAMAGDRARGSTAYVTLEPCAHQGQTPPCTEALVAAGVCRTVIATRDRNPRVAGAGVARLREAGIEVVEGLLRDEADEIAAGFFSVVERGRPLVTLKLATTLDGRIATARGESQWITGAPARRMAHALRGRHDAVMVGVGTVLADDPDLTCRIDGFRTRPVVRVVADRTLRTPPGSRLVRTARETPTWLLAGPEADPARRAALVQAGVEVSTVPASEHGVELLEALRALARRGLTRVLVEGGATLAGNLVRDDLVDRLVWAHAPLLMGGNGMSAIQDFGVQALSDARRFSPCSDWRIGDDMLVAFSSDPKFPASIAS